MRRSRVLARASALQLALAGAALPCASTAHAAPSVWVIDDGEKIRRDAAPSPLARGEGNPVWKPGQPVRVFAMQDESIALQVVVAADGDPLASVTVDLAPLVSSTGASIAEVPMAPENANRIVGRPIERFVEHFVHVRRPSGGRTAGESLGWDRGAAPFPGAFVGDVPDALVPVEIAPPWAPYPMRIAPRTNGIVWIDVNVPAAQAPGTYRGHLVARDGTRTLASIDVELEVEPMRLTARPAEGIAYYDPEEIERRMGDQAGEIHLWKILHAHRIAPLHDATSAADVERQHDALDGSLYTPERGYLGTARGVGDGVLTIGAYGGMGEATSESDARVRDIADGVAAAGLFDRTDVFLYAADEDCDSPAGKAWRLRLGHSDDPNERRVKVGWTCSHDPGEQPVDVVMMDSTYDPGRAAVARANGKEVWVYNGAMPRTGTFLLDAEAVSPRVNGWLEAEFDVPHWFYWESTYWYDRHGKRAFDPFADAESFHNDDGDWANGDGVLVYPGRQRDAFEEHSLGFDGVIPSIRLKNWRRGVEDAEYVRLALTRNRDRTVAAIHALVPAAFKAARSGRPAAWSRSGQPFFEARRRLLDIIAGTDRAPALPPPSGAPGNVGAPQPSGAPGDGAGGGTRGSTWRPASAATAVAFGATLAAALWTRKRRGLTRRRG